MTESLYGGFAINVLLRQSIGVHDSEVVEVSKDIWDELLALTSSRSHYLAISVATTTPTSWQMYPTNITQDSSLRHSTVWLPPGPYSLFCDQTVYARAATPVTLSSLVIAFPIATYNLVKHDHISLQLLAQQGQIFRTGEQIHLDGYRGQVDMCEPVRQGIIDAQTEVILVQAAEADMHNVIVNDNHGTEMLSISSLLESSCVSLSPTQHLNYSLSSIPSTVARHFDVEPLTFPIKTHSTALQDPDYQLFGSVELLLSLNYFSGDLVEVAAVPFTESQGRRTLIVSSLSSDRQGIQHDTFYLCPVLYHNIFGQAAVPKLEIHRLKRRKPLPVAGSVTLSRVPSPASIDRALQAAFLTALKTHFEHCRRIVREGDLVLLGIDENLARVSSLDETENEMLAEYSLVSGRGDDTFAWFKVMEIHLDHDVRWSENAIVDAESTRMVQAGVQKARIPALQTWAGFYSLPISFEPSQQSGSPYAQLTELVGSTFSRSARRARTCATILVHGARGIGKRSVASSCAAALGMHFLEVNCYDIVGETDVKTEAHLRIRFDYAAQCSPCLLLLRNIDALAKKKDDMESGQESKFRFILADCLAKVAIEAGQDYPVAVVATTSEFEKIPDGVLGCFRHVIEIGAPSEEERHTMLQNLVKGLPLAPDVSIQSVAVRSAALVASDLVNVVKKAQSFAQDRMDGIADGLGSHGTIDVLVAGCWITASDFELAIGDARRNYSDSIGAPKIPNVSWDDVGGLASVKDDIMDTIQLPLERPELFASGMKKRSGILFYGPPGTGKTLLAKAVATSFSLNFFSVKGPELLNMYIGESEANVRRVFQRARDAKPCVIFFDELDSVAPKRGNQGDSGGVMDRIVSQLLSELDGMSEGKDGSGGVFIIGATNRPDLLDPALLRPGRFDKMLYLGVSDTDAAQLNILQALTRKFKLAPDLKLEEIAKACPFTYTGADFYALCSDAMLKAMTRQAAAVDAKVKALEPARSTQYFFDHLSTAEDTQVIVSEVDFRSALQELVPSVSQSELNHYKTVQAQFNPIKIEGTGKDDGHNGKSNGHTVFTEEQDDADMYA